MVAYQCHAEALRTEHHQRTIKRSVTIGTIKRSVTIGTIKHLLQILCMPAIQCFFAQRRRHKRLYHTCLQVSTGTIERQFGCFVRIGGVGAQLNRHIVRITGNEVQTTVLSLVCTLDHVPVNITIFFA